MKCDIGQHPDVKRPQIGIFAASCFAKAEALRAAFGILLLKVVGSIGAVFALLSLDVLLTEASLKYFTKLKSVNLLPLISSSNLILLIANFESCSAKIAAAGLAVWEVKESISAFVAAPADDVRGAHARSVVEVALKVSKLDTMFVTIALFAPNNLIESECVWHALVTLLASDSRWANTLAGLLLANSGGWAVARLAVREPVESSLAGFALTSDDVRFA